MPFRPRTAQVAAATVRAVEQEAKRTCCVFGPEAETGVYEERSYVLVLA